VTHLPILEETRPWCTPSLLCAASVHRAGQRLPFSMTGGGSLWWSLHYAPAIVRRGICGVTAGARCVRLAKVLRAGGPPAKLAAILLTVTCNGPGGDRVESSGRWIEPTNGEDMRKTKIAVCFWVLILGSFALGGRSHAQVGGPPIGSWRGDFPDGSWLTLMCQGNGNCMYAPSGLPNQLWVPVAGNKLPRREGFSLLPTGPGGLSTTCTIALPG